MTPHHRVDIVVETRTLTASCMIAGAESMLATYGHDEKYI